MRASMSPCSHGMTAAHLLTGQVEHLPRGRLDNTDTQAHNQIIGWKKTFLKHLFLESISLWLNNSGYLYRIANKLVVLSGCHIRVAAL